MSKRALMFLGLYGFALVGALVFPPLGVWGFLFESNYHPPFRWWAGALRSYGDRWSFYIGFSMGLGMLLHWGRYQHVRLTQHGQSLLLGLFTLNAFFVTLAWSADFDASWKEATDIAKWLLVYVCIIKTHSDRRWLPIVMYIYIFTLIDAGWTATFDPKGGRDVGGGPVTAGAGNFLALHTVAFLPLVSCYLFVPTLGRRLRLAFLIGLPLMLNIVAHAQSRGAFLAIIAAVGTFLVAAPGKLRGIAVVAILAGSILAARLFHEQFWTRVDTLQTYEEEGSAMGRIQAWGIAWDAAKQHPLGLGGEAFDLAIRRQGDKTTHNIFFECLIAWGWQGTCCFFGFVGVTLWDCWKLRRAFWHPGAAWPPPREFLDVISIFAGLVAMLVGSMFLNRMRWELWWVFGAYVVCLKNIHEASLLAGPPREDDERLRDRQWIGNESCCAT